jgi:hypothetical protein
LSQKAQNTRHWGAFCAVQGNLYEGVKSLPSVAGFVCLLLLINLKNMSKEKIGNWAWYTIGLMMFIVMVTRLTVDVQSYAGLTYPEQLGSAFAFGVVHAIGVGMLLSLMPIPWFKDKNHCIGVGLIIAMMLAMVVSS